MGEYRSNEGQQQAGSSCVRDRMDQLYNNLDMADLHILAVDEEWWWGQTVKDFTAHRLVLGAASPVFHQLFYPVEDGPAIPACLSLSQSNSSSTGGLVKLEVEGIPPIAVEALLEYCYKDRFNRKDYENGYSRNLLWRLWHAAQLFQLKHLFGLCAEALEATMCEETIFWDLNYCLTYAAFGTDQIKKKVCELVQRLGNGLYEHPNLVWLDTAAVRELLTSRTPASSEPLVVFNNMLRWSLYQMDRILCEEVNGRKDSDITVEERLQVIEDIRHGKIKDYSICDILKYCERVLDLVPWTEFSQKDFLRHVVPANLLTKDQLIASSTALMAEVVKNPNRLTRSAYFVEHDPTRTFTPLTKMLETTSSAGGEEKWSPLKSRPSIRTSLEQARLRRSNADRTVLQVEEEDEARSSSNLLLVE